ncbi:MAG: AAA family ATPase, partial [Endomicrobium sp.]|nr:AAA family ATPase [Endomicrobium sp.]
MKNLPIGLQTLEDLRRRRNGIYVDKTEHIYNMVTTASKFYFLSRPRRFGKSLLISTIKELFKG